MNVLLFHGRGFVSWAIRCQTRGKYSHAALELRDGSIIEAWQGAGVRRLRELKHGWDGVDRYRTALALPVDIEDKLEYEAMKILGLKPKYDYWGVLRFVSRSSKGDLNTYFCSELVMEVFCRAGYPLLEAPPWMVAPHHLSWSTRLVKTNMWRP